MLVATTPLDWHARPYSTHSSLTRLLCSLLTDVPAPTAHAPPELISHSHSPARQLLMGDERSALALRVKPATSAAAQLQCEWLHFTSQNKPFNLALHFIPVDLSNANDSPTYHLIGSLLFINKDGSAIEYGKDLNFFSLKPNLLH